MFTSQWLVIIGSLTDDDSDIHYILELVVATRIILSLDAILCTAQQGKRLVMLKDTYGLDIPHFWLQDLLSQLRLVHPGPYLGLDTLDLRVSPQAHMHENSEQGTLHPRQLL
jgi:hypothetical protein